MQKPQPIRLVLEKTLKDLEIDVPLKRYSIWGAWKEIVGDSIARQTQPRAIRNRILFINVSHSTWIQQLQFLKPKLLEKINDFLGESPIQDIRFKLGKVSSPPPTPSKIPHWQEEVLDEETLKQMESHLRNIENNEVKRGLRDIFTKGARLERSRKKAK